MGDVSIRPDVAAEGAGLADDFDGIISDVRFIMTDYDGHSTKEVPVGQVTFDVDGEEIQQIYPVGGDGDFIPDETGHGLNKLKTKATLTKRCSFIQFTQSLVEQGFPLNRMDMNDCTSVVGTKGHFLRVPNKFAMKKKEGERESTILLCNKIIELPGEGGTGKGKGGKGKAAAAANSQLADSVAEIVSAEIIGAGGEIPKKNLLTSLFKNADIEALGKKDALKLVGDDSYLKSRSEWEYEDGVLKMA